jgi:hypothetical protein
MEVYRHMGRDRDAVMQLRRTAFFSCFRMFSSPFERPMMPFSLCGMKSPVSLV